MRLRSSLLRALRSPSMSRSVSSLKLVEQKKIMTVDEVTRKFDQLMELRQAMRANLARAGVHPKVPSSELPVRRPSDSFVPCYVPMSDVDVQRRFAGHGGTVRLGKLLENIDMLAGLICLTHEHPDEFVQNTKSHNIVTINMESVDNLRPDDELSSEKHIFMSGRVAWIGSSSVQCVMYIEQEVQGVLEKFFATKFLMAARDLETNTSVPLNPLNPETREEEQQYLLGQDSKRQRREEAETSLTKEPLFTDEEKQLLHTTLLSEQDEKNLTYSVDEKLSNTVWMEDTCLSTVVVGHPENLNIYKRIFGGTLIEKSLELATSTVSLYSRNHRVICTAIRDFRFLRATAAGDILKLSSQIVYTDGSNVQVYVKIHAERPWENTRELTHDCYFTFDTRVPDLPQVIPRTYVEAMSFLMGRRKYKRI